MRDRLITSDGVELELEDRELEETSLPPRLREILEEFAEVQGLSRRREWLDEGFISQSLTQGLPEGRLPSLRTPGPRWRFSKEWWKQRYARLKADPERYAKDHAQKLAWQRKKYREDAEYRKRRNQDASRRMRAWCARAKADPDRKAKLLADICRRAKARYQKLKTDPALRDKYEAVLAKARQRAARNHREKRRAR